jgi:RNA polymerase sigma-70 factor (ECF subfamily)
VNNLTPLAETDTAIHSWLEHRDEAAARWLVETHRPAVLRVVRSWLPSEVIEDVVQEVFMKAFIALPRLLPGARLEPWLSSIARNTCANVLRSWKRRFIFTTAECGLDDLSEFIIANEQPFADDESHRDLCITRLLAQLQRQDRRILWLYHVEGRTAADVGRQVGLSAGTVRVRALRSQRALREKAMQLRANGDL